MCSNCGDSVNSRASLGMTSHKKTPCPLGISQIGEIDFHTFFNPLPKSMLTVIWAMPKRKNVFFWEVFPLM